MKELGGKRRSFGKANSRCNKSPELPCSPDFFKVNLQNNGIITFGGKNVGGNFKFQFPDETECDSSSCPNAEIFKPFFDKVRVGCNGLVIHGYSGNNEDERPPKFP